MSETVSSMGETSKVVVWGSLYNLRTDTNWYHHQSVTKLQAWFHDNDVLSCKTWIVAKSGIWLARPPSGAQQPQDSSPILSKVLQVLHSQQAVIPSHSQSGQCPGRLEARSETCSALSLKPKQDYFIFLTLWYTYIYTHTQTYIYIYN